MGRTLLQVMAPTALLFLGGVSQSRAQHAPKHSADEDAVLKVDEAFRRAKQENDTAALRHIVANNYLGTNQFGETRNKADLLELFTTISVKSVTSKPSQVRITGDVAVVTGSQSEVNGGGFNAMLFMRVYVRNREAGEWQLLANMQSLAPN
jgi:hypothetical protein